MRSGETEQTRMGGCRRSSWWTVSGWSYTLSLLYVPGEVGKKEYTSPFQWEAWSKNILCLIIPTKSLLKVGGQGGAWQRFSSAVVQREMTSYFELPICPERGPFLRHHTFPRVFLTSLLSWQCLSVHADSGSSSCHTAEHQSLGRSKVSSCAGSYNSERNTRISEWVF